MNATISKSGLVLVLLLGACAACGRNESPTTSTPTAAGSAVPQSAPSAAAPAEAADSATFLHLEWTWAEAIARHDRPALDDLLAPEFIITGVGSTADDPVGGRAEWLDKVPEYPWPHHEVLGVHLAAASTDVVVVKCIWRGVYPPKSLTDAGGTVSLLETDVWARRNGRWVVVARHTSLPRAE